MCLFSAKMGNASGTIFCWLQKGASIAKDTLGGWIWEAVMSLVKKLCEVFQGLFKDLSICFLKEKVYQDTPEGRFEV